MKNARPESLTLERLATPVGEVLLVTDAEGAVRALDFVEYEDRMTRLLKRHAPRTTVVEGRAGEPARSAVIAYFAGDAQALERVTLKTSGTDFQEAVWAALRAIPAGETRSYGQLAAAVGSPKAVRAAGMANGRNPIALINPCHRVIGADGSLTGYAGGLERKRWLLRHEGVTGV